jgi:hypothetical protein
LEESLNLENPVLAPAIVTKEEIVHAGIKMIKNLFKKMLGIDKLEENLKTLKDMEAKAVASTAEAQLAEQEAKATPKERATLRGEPYVAVLDTHVNKDNIRNGFFELDWNDEFIVQLKQAGYGFDGDPEEEIVDRWFRDLAGNMLAEAGQDTSRVYGGYINVSKLGGGKAAIE